jgi:recombination protein RecA
MDDARRKRLEQICKQVNSGEFGGEHKDALAFCGSTEETTKLIRWSSGCPALDKALGGGWPRGRFIELYGPESSGKTTLTLHAIAEYQKKWPEEDVAFIDTEFAFEEEYAKALGVNVDHLIVHQPDNAEQALNVLKQLVQLGVKLFVVDSVAALSSIKEQEGDLGDIPVGMQARLMASSLRQLAGICGRADATVLWTNQLREKIGVTYGDKTTTPAGRALKHYASVRTAIARIGSEKEMVDGEKINVCNHVKVDVKKNKTAPPFRVAKFYITFGFGIDMVAAYLDGALKAGVVKKSGGWHSIGDIKIGNGRLNVLNELRENDEMLEDLKTAVETGEIPAKYSVDDTKKTATKSKASTRKKAKAKTEPEADPLADMDEEAIEREPVTQEQLDAMGGVQVDVQDV